MNTDQRVLALENLLARVRTRAAERPQRAAASPLAAAAAPALELDEAFAGETRPSFDDPPSLSRPPAQLAAEAAPQSVEVPSADFEEIEDLDDVEEVSDNEIDLDEPPPASHSSPVATSMEQALASAAQAPPLTPPPESGPEPAHPVHAAHPGPTMEQLGETIALEEGPDRAFELDEPLVDAEPVVPSSSRELEADLPGSAVRDLDELEPVAAAPAGARVTARPHLSTNVVDFVGKARGAEPQTFAQLLDASLSL